MSYIKSCKLSGYKSIKNVSCEFKEGLNILIGNNGSGKSNLLEFIDFLYSPLFFRLGVFKADIVSGALNSNETYTWGAEGTNSPDSVIGRTIAYEYGIDKRGPESTEFISFNIPTNVLILAEEFNPKYNVKDKHLIVAQEDEVRLITYLDVLFSFYFKVYHLSKIDHTEDITDQIVSDILQKLFEDHLSQFRSHLINYTPIEDIRFSNSIRVAKIDSSTIEIRNIVFEYKINNEWFSWNGLSDGTKRLIYIFMRLEWSTLVAPEPIILLEEPEIGIHPHQLHLLMTFLKEKSKEQQIIISTHSPQVLDVLGADELDRIKIAEIDYERGTIIRGLTEEETKKAKQYLQNEGLLSDYWRFSDFQRSKQSK